MDKSRFYLVFALVLVVTLLAVACASNNVAPAPTGTVNAISQEKSQKIAENFVKNEATFVFDGIADTLQLTNIEVMRSPYTWAFTYEYDSRHAGYGDRTDQAVAQVITHHKAIVIVQQGKVGSAVMDDRWDMIEQRMLNSN